MKKVQFGTEVVMENEKNNGYIILKYYLIESPVGFGYSELKSYGIEVVRTDRKPGLQDMSECKQIEGVFFDIEEAISFIADIKKHRVMPTKLCKALDGYIKEKVRKHREKCKYTTQTV
ncbi:MAG: DUF6514 family protein [Clostridia bacterium]|nr:DUF6514 family protein [Clostridia bacterium]